MAKKDEKAPNPRLGKARKSKDGTAAVIEPGVSAAPSFFDAGKVADDMALYWQSGKGEQYLRKMTDGRWASWPGQAVVDAMRKRTKDIHGRLLTIKAREDAILSEVKEVLLFVKENRWVDEVFAALPGYGANIYELETGEQVLVKSAPKLIEPVQGEWPTIAKLINGRLDTTKAGTQTGIDQTPYFHSWCKVALDALRRGQPGHWRQGHAMILTGPAGCGKNRIQEQLITGLLGGRAANPSKFLFDGDEFNGDVFAAEHLLMGELPIPSQKTVDRNTVAERIKQVVANAAQRMRLMRVEPWTVYPFWRLTISLNDHPDKLHQLPLITGDFGDKVLLFHCAHEPLPMPTRTIDEQRAFRDAITSELPAYAFWLLNTWEIPDELTRYDDGRDAMRFGFREFHHPIIKGELFDDTPASQLLGFIDLAEFTSSEWEGSRKLWQIESNAEGEGVWWERADILQQLLTGDGPYMCTVAQLAKKLFAHAKCSQLLARLANEESTCHRVVGGEDARTKHWRGWKIARPSMI